MTVQFIDVKQTPIDGDEYSDPTPRRTFDVLTPPERLGMWCAHLEMTLEDQAGRLTMLELVNQKQAQRIKHLECIAHRWLNPGEVSESTQVEP